MNGPSVIPYLGGNGQESALHNIRGGILANPSDLAIVSLRGDAFVLGEGEALGREGNGVGQNPARKILCGPVVFSEDGGVMSYTDERRWEKTKPTIKGRTSKPAAILPKVLLLWRRKGGGSFTPRSARAQKI